MTGVSIEWFEARIPCGPISKWFQAVPNPQDDNAFIEALAAHDALWRKSIEHHASDVESEMPDMNLGLWRAVLAVYAPDGKVGVTCKGCGRRVLGWSLRDLWGHAWTKHADAIERNAGTTGPLDWHADRRRRP